MTLYDLFFLSVALAMDAFAVSVCKGFTLRKINFGNAVTVGLYFGVFQAIMPFFGFLLANLFSEQIQGFDHWVAFVLLGALGVKMIIEAVQEKEECCDMDCGSIRFRVMLPLAVATSIDALAAGITLRLKGNVDILAAIAIIGVVTFIICALGVWIGHIFSVKFQKKAEIAGGVILILLGVKILLEDLGFISF
ncbi:MAG TPA: manganese efflux pump MntP family protein [Bacillota bacterium]|nr:manganese efflux pump MntP family protein [Bacillota bacterium]